MGIHIYFKGGTPSQTSWCPWRTRKPSWRKVEWFVGASGTEYSVRSTLGLCKTFGESFREHLRDPFPFMTMGHQTSVDNFSIGGRASNSITRTNEAIYIRVNNPSFNRNTGKYQMSHIWAEVLFNTPDFKLKQLSTLIFGLLPLAHTTSWEWSAGGTYSTYNIITYCAQVGMGKAYIKQLNRCHILATHGTTSITFQTGSIQFTGLNGFTICHVIYIALHLPHITQHWWHLQFVQCG